MGKRKLSEFDAKTYCLTYFKTNESLELSFSMQIDSGVKGYHIAPEVGRE